MQEIIANDGSERDVRGDGAVRGDCGWIRGQYDTVGESATAEGKEEKKEYNTTTNDTGDSERRRGWKSVSIER